jgi:hypothetical protein
MRLIASGEHTVNRRRRRRILVLFLATLLVCWGAGPALASEEAEVAATDTAQPDVDLLDVTQPGEVTTPVPDTPGEIETPSTSDSAVETGANTDDSTEDAADDASSDGPTNDSGSGTSDNRDPPTIDFPGDPDADSDPSTTTPSQDSGSGTVDAPADDGGVDPSNGVIDPSSGELSDTDIADMGGGQDSGSTGDQPTVDEGSSSDTENPTSDGNDSSEDPSSGETPQPEIEQTPDNDSSGDELPDSSDKDGLTDKEQSDEADKADEEETEVGEGTPSTEDDAAEATDVPDTDVIEDYVPTGTEIASDEKEEADSPKDRKNEPSPRAVRSDLNAYGSAYTGVKSGRSSSPWKGAAERQEPSLAHLVEGGNRIEGTASFELVAEERKGQTKQSAQAFGKGFSLPFSNGFGMPLTGFDILVMSLMGLSLILVGVVLFARGLERQSAARRSTKRREALEAPPPASRESVPLSTRIRGFKRKRVV